MRLGGCDTRAMLATSVLLLVAMLCGCAGSHGAARSVQEGILRSSEEMSSLDGLMETFWLGYMSEAPTGPNSLGDHTYTDRLDAIDDEAIVRRLAAFDEALDRLSHIRREELSPANRYNYDIFEWMLRNERSVLALPTRLFQVTSLGGWHSTLPQLLSGTPLDSRDAVLAYVARLNDVSRYADDTIAVMREGIRTGYVQPCAAMAGFGAAALAMVPADASTSFAFYPLKNSIHADEQLRGEGLRSIKHSVIPAYQRFAAFLVDEYLPSCRKSEGLVHLDGGRAAYDQLVRYYSTDPDMTADRAHAIGLRETAVLLEEMRNLKKSLGFEGDLATFFQTMRERPDLRTSDPEIYLGRVALVAKRVDAVLPSFFEIIPRNRFAIIPAPEDAAPRLPAAFYLPGSRDGAASGRYFINLHDVDQRSMATLPAITLHEAEPGHHLQLTLQQEETQTPRFRNAYYISAFGEGWGLYAEYLGEEMGIYQDDIDRFGRLTMALWRAARLVVDTGIHAHGWSREKAINYMVENTALDRSNIEVEVDRYITLPGQAISYKLGELKILALRDAAQARLGDEFNLREWHSYLLAGGSAPLSAVEARMKRWVEDREGLKAR